MPNAPLLRGTMNHILTHPDEHNQLGWILEADCGTTRCFAGTALHLAKQDTNLEWYDLVSGTFGSEVLFMNGGGREATGFVGGGSIRDAAIELLGLTPRQAHELFRTNATIEELQATVDQLCAEEPVEHLVGGPGE